MKRIISIIVLLLIFAAFYFFVYIQNSSYEVLEVISPTEIVIDFNKNKISDKDEKFTLLDIYSFYTNIDKNKNVSKKLNLSNADLLSLGYMAEKFANEILENKKVRINKNEIFIDDINYKSLLISNGFAFLKSEKPNNKLNENLKASKNLDLVILNLKNNKYHKMDCQYGQQALKTKIMPKRQLSKDSEPCGYCFKINVKKENFSKKSKPKLNLYNGNIQLILSDMTTKLKPTNDCSNKICQTLLKEINSANSSIDFAIYGYTKNKEIDNALLSAQNRGVKIRYIFDTNPKNTNIYPDTFYLASLIKDNKHDTTDAIMHNKFFIFDDKKVFTGSSNLSNSDMSGFNSNAVLLINSSEVASVYKREFEQMFNGKFHKEKVSNNQNRYSDIQIYFSPQDKIITNKIIPLIDKAQKYIYIPTFIITHEEFAQSLIKAKKRGVDVKIILDSTNTREPSKLKNLRTAKIPVKTENYAGKLHSKSIIIDDKYLVIGSMNFSLSGEYKNDENCIILINPKLAKDYRLFFEYLWDKIPNKWLILTAKPESPDSIGSCSDGIDNNFDGDIDKKDKNCLSK